MRKRRGSPRQVGTGKANASEPLMTRRDEEMASKPGYPNNPGIRPGGCPSIGQVMPGVKVARARSAASAWNVGRQAPIRPRDRGSFRVAVRGSASTGENRKVLSTVVASAGGPARSSGEPPVMGGERRGRVIYEVFTRATGEVFREEPSGQVRPDDPVVRDCEAAGVGGVKARRAQQGRRGGGRGVHRGLREGSEEQFVQGLEPDVLGNVLSAPGQVGGHTEAGWRHANVGRADRGRQDRPDRGGNDARGQNRGDLP